MNGDGEFGGGEDGGLSGSGGLRKLMEKRTVVMAVGGRRDSDNVLVR